MRTLVWFRSDLRTGDHTALHAAAERSTRGVVGVFVVCPEEWRGHDWAPAKVGLTLRTLAELSVSLRRLNIPLRVLRVQAPGGIPRSLLGLATQTGCDVLSYSREYELNESRRDERVAELFEANGLRVEAVHDQVLIPPGDLRTQQGRLYTVFTPFKNALYARLTAHGIPAPLPQPREQAAMPCAPDEVPNTVEGWDTAHTSPLWPGGEAEAQRRLDRFARQHVRSYKDRRDQPAAEGTSTLSPYLTAGAVSVRQCLAAALRANPAPGGGSPLSSGDAGATCWISELIWREFYIHIMAGFPRVCMHRAFQPATELIRWTQSEAVLKAWENGRTGIPIVDAGMRQLAATGWMHNRVRMITAMFLSKNLFLDWRLGERWFMRNLVDGFLASNNGGWQWSASTGTDAAPYFRVFNPVSQGQTHDPEGTYVARWVPELEGLPADAVHTPWELAPLARSRISYPDPIVDLKVTRARAIEAFRNLGSA